MSIAFMWIMITILGGIYHGGGGSAVSTLAAANITASATSVTVKSTNNFAKSGDIYVEDEKIVYYDTDATHFKGTSSHALERGADGTTAVAHLLTHSGTIVTGPVIYTKESNTLKNLPQTAIADVQDSSGIWLAITIPLAVFKFIGYLLIGPFTFLGTDLAIISYLWIAVVGIGFIFSVGLAMAGTRRI